MSNQIKKKKRVVSPYEKTHLSRFGKDQIDIDEYGQMPVEYITGKVEFCGNVLSITPQTLIPRVETEELVSLVVEHVTHIAHQQQTKKSQLDQLPIITIGDIGTGCGAIGISLYQQLIDRTIPTKIFLTDISKEALKIAQQNILKIIGTTINIQTLTSDLLSALPNNNQFDVLCANLPYIPSARVEYLDQSVKDYEPHLALDGGDQGFTLIDTFLTQAPTRLKPQASIFLELDYTHQITDFQKFRSVFTIQIHTSQISKTKFAQLTLR